MAGAAVEDDSITITTFGWKHRGRPPGQDYYVDAWLLPNPYTQHQAETGLDAPVIAWFEKRPAVADQIRKWIEVARARKAKKIAIGCQGGRHRSVYTAEQMAKALRASGHQVTINHIELTKEKN